MTSSQDTNKLQYAWLKLMAGGNAAVFAVGENVVEAVLVVLAQDFVALQTFRSCGA